MNRNYNLLTKREKLVKTAMDDPREAAKQIRSVTRKLNKAHTTTEAVKALSELLCVSEVTVYRDFSK